jgi:hypothetical protein
VASDVRLIQLSRMLNLALPGLDRDGARQAIAVRPDMMASALFSEAADNDDVISAEAALQYLEDRLSYFGDYVPAECAEEIRTRFKELVSAWEG